MYPAAVVINPAESTVSGGTESSGANPVNTHW
jgi:hypothetical protein